MFLKMSVAVKGFWRSLTFVVESLDIQFGLTSDSLGIMISYSLQKLIMCIPKNDSWKT